MCVVFGVCVCFLALCLGVLLFELFRFLFISFVVLLGCECLFGVCLCMRTFAYDVVCVFVFVLCVLSCVVFLVLCLCFCVCVSNCV